MPERRAQPQQYLEAMMAFCRIPVDKGVNNFVISGPVRDEPFLVGGFAGMFPINASSKYVLAIAQPSTTGIVNVVDYYHKILELQVDDRVKGFNIPDNTRAFVQNKKICVSAGLPMFCLSFGNYQADSTGAVTIHVVQGISPETALKELQNKARFRLRDIQ